VQAPILLRLAVSSNGATLGPQPPRRVLEPKRRRLQVAPVGNELVGDASDFTAPASCNVQAVCSNLRTPAPAACTRCWQQRSGRALCASASRRARPCRRSITRWRATWYIAGRPAPSSPAWPPSDISASLTWQSGGPCAWSRAPARNYHHREAPFRIWQRLHVRMHFEQGRQNKRAGRRINPHHDVVGWRGRHSVLKLARRRSVHGG